MSLPGAHRGPHWSVALHLGSISFDITPSLHLHGVNTTGVSSGDCALRMGLPFTLESRTTPDSLSVRALVYRRRLMCSLRWAALRNDASWLMLYMAGQIDRL